MITGYKRIVVLLLTVIIQIFIIFSIFHFFPTLKSIAVYSFTMLSIVIALLIIGGNSKPEYKVSWIALIYLTPILGGIIYLMSERSKRKKVVDIIEHGNEFVDNIKDDSDIIEKLDKDIKKQLIYLKKWAHSAIYKNNDIEYFPEGEAYWLDLLNEMKKAKKFIFIEYYKMYNGKMFGKIKEVLIKKAKEGVDVRISFDELGSIFRRENFIKSLEKYGIKCFTFNSRFEDYTTAFNNRDHRKIAVIDGLVAYTGGINISDEYINIEKPFGYWKDTGIKITGSSVNSFTVMILTLFGIHSKEKQKYINYMREDYNIYENISIISPYTNYPMIKEEVAENIYLNLINNSKEYIYIITPYIALNSVMLNSLLIAQKSGVDVRIITTKENDSFVMEIINRSYYNILIDAGVKIYEYEAGFIHSKQMISDDTTAIIGTINLDYRSLSHNLENAVWIYNHSCIKEMKEDFLDTMEMASIQSKIKVGTLYKIFILPALKLVSPLL